MARRGDALAALAAVLGGAAGQVGQDWRQQQQTARAFQQRAAEQAAERAAVAAQLAESRRRWEAERGDQQRTARRALLLTPGVRPASAPVDPARVLATYGGFVPGGAATMAEGAAWADPNLAALRERPLGADDPATAGLAFDPSQSAAAVAARQRSAERAEDAARAVALEQLRQAGEDRRARIQAGATATNRQETRDLMREQQRFTRMSQLADDVRGDKVIQEANTIGSSLMAMRQHAKAGTPQSDISLIFAYMKLQDPGSTVREGEFATAQNAGGIGDSIRNQYNKLVRGEGFLTPDQRARMLHEAEARAQSHRQLVRAALSEHAMRAAAAGIPSEQVMRDPYSTVLGAYGQSPAAASVTQRFRGLEPPRR